MWRIWYGLKHKVRKLFLKCTGKKVGEIGYYNGHKVMTDEAFQQELSAKIKSGIPFAAVRFGSVELRCIVEDEDYQKKGKNCFSEKTYCSMGNNAGFFPVNAEKLHLFSVLMKESGKQIDYLGVWCNPFEDYIAKKYAKNAITVHLRALEPYYSKQPWSSALKGKKVLVIHPFAESIKKQYEKRNKVWGEREMLPEFELKVIKAVQTAAGEKDERFTDWFDALEYMKNQVRSIEFDIAILGCGAYGFLLATYIKCLGKQAIHMGGATQILFGIRGKRWDENPIISKFYNDAWIRPGEGEVPVGSKSVENGCYW